MDLLVILMRVFLIGFVWSIPSVLLGLASFGAQGALAGLLLTLFVLLLGAMCSERGVARSHFAGPNTIKGLRRSLEVASQSFKGPLPRLFVFADSSPSALAVRALGGRGTILLSQGLISLLNEEELRIVLILCLVRLRERGIVFQSFCSILGIWALSFAPRPWVNLVFTGRSLSRIEEKLLSPMSAVGFLILFPIARFFFNLAKPVFSRKKSVYLGDKYLTAMQKIAQTFHICGSFKSLTVFSLYVIDPGSEKMLFPYP